jgi:hypothetical protein
MEQLRSLDHRTLHRLLCSESLAIKSEDSLLELLVELRVNRSDFFGCIEISFLSTEGLAHFLDELSFDALMRIFGRKESTGE